MVMGQPEGLSFNSNWRKEMRVHLMPGSSNKTVLLLAGLLVLPTTVQQGTLTGRWVGQHRNVTLHLEFYGDTMLVVNDRHALNYRATSDSLIASGDTTIIGRYWFSLGRLILETTGGAVLTMSRQPALARPLTGRWVGELGTADGTAAELLVLPGGVARWRGLSGGSWAHGEWERQSRVITFVWAADSTDWVGHYDVDGNAIVFAHTVPGSRTAIFRRAFR